jgi:hypothetical protein
VWEKTAHFLIATDFAALPAGLRMPAQQVSTNLSTDFCGYRRIHYIGPRDHYNLPRLDAVRKLAALRWFGLKSPHS